MNNNEMKIEYTRKSLPPEFVKGSAILFSLGFVILCLGFFSDHIRAAFNSLILLMFLCSVGLGSLFLVSLEYISGAVWSTPFRRIPEFLAAILLLIPVVAFPVFINMHELFHWTHQSAVASDPILKGKEAYLNIEFFSVRGILFFVLWILFYLLITRTSLKQDNFPDQKLTKKNIRQSAFFIPLFAITITFAAIDWIMSLEPHWFSTIFGIYFFSGTVLAALAATTFIVVYLNEKGYFVRGIKSEHYYSFGALLFAFTNFWAYIAFSQFLLIWYANLPEETFWYLARWKGGWITISIILIFVRFVVPYIALLSQPSKMNPTRLKFISIWILLAHFIDIFWLVMPAYSKENIPIGWIELGTLIISIGIIGVIFSVKASKNNLVPIGDPKLRRGINFRL